MLKMLATTHTSALSARLKALALAAGIAIGCLQLSEAGASNRFSTPQIKRAQSTGPDDFQPALSIVLNRMLVSYQTEVDKPLRIDVLGVNNPAVKRLFDNINQPYVGSSYDPHSILALNYSDVAKFNGKPTSACLVRYNSKERMQLLTGYERSGIFDKEAILYYLAAHEFGHCVAFHQISINRMPKLDLKEHELVADKFAMAFFAVNEQPHAAKQIIEFNRRFVDSDIHSHHEELEQYYDRLIAFLSDGDHREIIRSMYGVYQLAVDL